jgi:hypothetical protein
MVPGTSSHIPDNGMIYNEKLPVWKILRPTKRPTAISLWKTYPIMSAEARDKTIYSGVRVAETYFAADHPRAEALGLPNHSTTRMADGRWLRRRMIGQKDTALLSWRHRFIDDVMIDEVGGQDGEWRLTELRKASRRASTALANLLLIR